MLNIISPSTTSYLFNNETKYKILAISHEPIIRNGSY
jgi:hypothetical protein